MKLTITEALADLKTINKRIEKKREYITTYLVMESKIHLIRRERQAIADLEKRFVDIRTAIQRANHENMILIEDRNKTISEWLTWRKEISAGEKAFTSKIRQAVINARTQAATKGWAVVPSGQPTKDFTDLVVNVDEGELAKQAEQIELVLGKLNGLLSLKNATTLIDVE
jgi:adenosyl cobinamide kinase/adenosyl cobinamide phosphate guanylyltransferase